MGEGLEEGVKSIAMCFLGGQFCVYRSKLRSDLALFFYTSLVKKNVSLRAVEVGLIRFLPLSRMLRQGSFLYLILRIHGINKGLSFQEIFDLGQLQPQLPQSVFVDKQLAI